MTKSHDPLRRHDFPERLPALSGAAPYRQDDPSVVRRERRGVDDLHALFPGAASRRLCLFARLRPVADTGAAPPSHRAPRARRGDSASRREHRLEARRRRRPDVADTGAPRDERRAALFRALHHGSPGAGLVRALARRRRALSPVCALQSGLDARAALVSARRRAAAHAGSSGCGLVDGVPRVRACVRGARLAEQGRRGAGPRGRRGGQARNWPAGALGGSRLLRIVVAARLCCASKLRAGTGAGFFCRCSPRASQESA